MSDIEEMDSDSDTFTSASQDPEKETSQTIEKETSQTTEASQEASQGGKTTKAKKTKEPAKTKDTAKKDQSPCIYCPKNCTSGAVQCTICGLWCHMACTGLSKEVLKGLELQAKEVGKAYWACKSCVNFNSKWNNQMKVFSKRQDKTDARVEENSANIEEGRKEREELRRELRELARRTDGQQERMEMVMDAELREREARRLNLVIHGLPEPEASIKDSRERMERDKEECEKLFIAMKARTRYQAVRFCRRIGEKGGDPRPMVFGVYSEEEKRHLLEKSKELLYTHYENVTVVPDMTKSQRRGEQKLREEADRRNTELTAEDREKNLKWLVVGKRGEKRLIKGVERDGQQGRQERERGPGTANSGWNPQISVNSSQRFNNDRRPGVNNWRPSNNWQGNNNSNYSGGGGHNNDRRNNYGGNYGSNSGGQNGGSGSYNSGGQYGGYNGGSGGYNNNGGQNNGDYNSGNQFSNARNNGNGIGLQNGGGNSNYSELGARPRNGNTPAQGPENIIMREPDMQARQQERRQVVEERGERAESQWRENGDRSIRNINQTTESSRMSTLLPRPPILPAAVTGQEYRQRLDSNKRGRSYDRNGEEEEEPPHLWSRRQ